MTNWAKIILGDSRAMPEMADGAVDLAVTSPPYWHIKDYGSPGQLGYGQSLHEYLKDLYCVWRECFRVLRPGGRLCINIGDQFARAAVYGRYKIIPLHAEFIAQGELLGFDFMGSIIWQKKTTMNTTGGAPVMGSYPFPPNGLIEIDYEFILIFKKPGASKKVAKEVKEASRLTKGEWKEYFSGHWRFGGARQLGHEAMFPEELPRRLIKMFTFAGDTVLDPFLGSGTTLKVALELGRNGLGYEINIGFLEIIREKIGIKDRLPMFSENIRILKHDKRIVNPPLIDYTPRIQESGPPAGPRPETAAPRVYRVQQVRDESTLLLDGGQALGFLGVTIDKKPEALKYLKDRLLGKNVVIKDGCKQKDILKGYVYLKNKLFINTYLIKSGLASPDLTLEHRYQKKFITLWQERIRP